MLEIFSFAEKNISTSEVKVGQKGRTQFQLRFFLVEFSTSVWWESATCWSVYAVDGFFVRDSFHLRRLPSNIGVEV
jgi:hypothetical protein